VKYAILLLLIGACLMGCNTGSDVSSSGVASKEKQIDEATKKLGAQNSHDDQAQ